LFERYRRPACGGTGLDQKIPSGHNLDTRVIGRIGCRNKSGTDRLLSLSRSGELLLNGKRRTNPIYRSLSFFAFAVGMTENQEIPGRKRRSSEEIKRLLLEFEWKKASFYRIQYRKDVGCALEPLLDLCSS
jgi:hypothetical protein